ncbi:MAG: hypothetical protein MHM6MM_003918 [Cercozoa sp. M6MM]
MSQSEIDMMSSEELRQLSEAELVQYLKDCGAAVPEGANGELAAHFVLVDAAFDAQWDRRSASYTAESEDMSTSLSEHALPSASLSMSRLSSHADASAVQDPDRSILLPPSPHKFHTSMCEEEEEDMIADILDEEERAALEAAFRHEVNPEEANVSLYGEDLRGAITMLPETLELANKRRRRKSVAYSLRPKSPSLVDHMAGVFAFFFSVLFTLVFLVIWYRFETTVDPEFATHVRESLPTPESLRETLPLQQIDQQMQRLSYWLQSLLP